MFQRHLPLPRTFIPRSFFKLVANHLNKNGIAIFQITEEHPATDPGFQSLLTTIRTVLPYTYDDEDGVVVLLVMGKSENKDTINAINAKIRDIQKKYNAAGVVHEYKVIKPTNPDSPIITDDYNLAEIYWRKKIPLFKRFNLLLPEDLM